MVRIFYLANNYVLSHATLFYRNGSFCYFRERSWRIIYVVPNEPETYFHHIGRTARAGAEGKAISLVTPERLGEFERILRLTKLPMKRLNEAMGTKVPYAQHRDRSNYRGAENHSRNSYYGQRRHQNERSHHYGSRKRDRSKTDTNPGRGRGKQKH